LDRSWRGVLRVGRFLGKDWEWGASEDLKRAHFSLKLDLLREGGIDFLWVQTRLITFQTSVWLADERLGTSCFFAALDQAFSDLWQRSNSSSDFFFYGGGILLV
jgi:hypothetical protein